MNSKVTLGVKITISTRYEPRFSSDKRMEYLFSYSINIENFNDFPVQLMKRHWVITDGVGVTRIVDGPGVVGKQPIISSFDKFNYESACDFKTTMGAMEGYYVFKNIDSGKLFKVDIPQFVMATAHKLN